MENDTFLCLLKMCSIVGVTCFCTFCQALIEQNEALVSSCRELETELDTAKRAMATSDEDRIMSLTLELEKERGKLAGAWW